VKSERLLEKIEREIVVQKRGLIYFVIVLLWLAAWFSQPWRKMKKKPGQG